MYPKSYSIYLRGTVCLEQDLVAYHYMLGGSINSGSFLGVPLISITLSATWGLQLMETPNVCRGDEGTVFLISQASTSEVYSCYSQELPHKSMGTGSFLGVTLGTMLNYNRDTHVHC